MSRKLKRCYCNIRRCVKPWSLPTNIRQGESAWWPTLFLPAEQTPSTGELRGALRSNMPEYMIPSIFIFLDALPLNLNGKVDRKALPDPKDWSESRGGAEELCKPPHRYGTVYRRSLARSPGVERVSAHDNFFDLGGHSLLSLKAVARIEEKLGQRIHPSEMVLQTLRQIASTYEQKASAVEGRYPSRLIKRWRDVITSLLSR